METKATIIDAIEQYTQAKELNHDRCDVTYVSSALSGVHALVKGELDEFLAARVLHERDEGTHIAGALRL